MDKKFFSLIVLFFVSYFFILIFSSVSIILHDFFANIPLINSVTNALFPLAQFDFSTFPWKADYLMILIPLPAFFFTYFLIDWGNEFFDTKFLLNPVFPVLFFIASLLMFQIVLIIYFGNISYLNGGQEIPFDVLNEFKNSPYAIFVFACIMGWASRKIMNFID
ncbi:MAG: hypothetical protein ABIA76_03060 [Candidatus Diapherotrites archaeon]